MKTYIGKQEAPKVKYLLINKDGEGYDQPMGYNEMVSFALDCLDLGDTITNEFIATGEAPRCPDKFDDQLWDFAQENFEQIAEEQGYRIVEVLQ